MKMNNSIDCRQTLIDSSIFERIMNSTYLDFAQILLHRFLS